MTVNAAQLTDKLDIETYVVKALELDANFLSSRVDIDLANARYEASNNLYKGIFSASPFSRNYKVLEPNSYSSSSFNEQGMKFGYTQFLPTGTQLSVTGDQYSENTRTSTFAKKNGYSFGLMQPLLRNYFGVSDRLNKDYYHQSKEVAVHKSTLVKIDSCVKAVGNFVDAWVSQEKKKFNDELLSLADELFKKSEQSKRSGQIGQLDWLGVQSEYLNQKNLSTQNAQLLADSILKLKAQVPELQNPSLKDPSSAFRDILNRIDVSSVPTSNFQIEQLAASVKALESKVRSEEKNSLPDLDFKVEKSSGSGSVAAEKYKEDDLTFGLNFTWKINDDSVDAQAKLAKLELQKLKYQYEEGLRNRKVIFENSIKDILSKEQQIKYEKERASLLLKITDENKKRFLQGRIEFQDFLRIKEQLLINQNSYLDKQSQMWKTLTSFAMSENIALPFCLGAK